MHTSNHLKTIKLPTIIGNGVEFVRENSGTRDFCTHKKFFFYFFYFLNKDQVYIYTNIHPIPNHLHSFIPIYTKTL